MFKPSFTPVPTHSRDWQDPFYIHRALINSAPFSCLADTPPVWANHIPGVSPCPISSKTTKCSPKKTRSEHERVPARSGGEGQLVALINLRIKRHAKDQKHKCGFLSNAMLPWSQNIILLLMWKFTETDPNHLLVLMNNYIHTHLSVNHRSVQAPCEYREYLVP